MRGLAFGLGFGFGFGFWSMVLLLGGLTEQPGQTPLEKIKS